MGNLISFYFRKEEKCQESEFKWGQLAVSESQQQLGKFGNRDLFFNITGYLKIQLKNLNRSNWVGVRKYSF